MLVLFISHCPISKDWPSSCCRPRYLQNDLNHLFTISAYSHLSNIEEEVPRHNIGADIVFVLAVSYGIIAT